MDVAFFTYLFHPVSSGLEICFQYKLLLFFSVFIRYFSPQNQFYALEDRQTTRCSCKDKWSWNLPQFERGKAVESFDLWPWAAGIKDTISRELCFVTVVDNPIDWNDERLRFITLFSFLFLLTSFLSFSYFFFLRARCSPHPSLYFPSSSSLVFSVSGNAAGVIATAVVILPP